MLFTALCGLVTALTSHGGARHLFYLQLTQVASIVKLNWVAQPFGIMALAFAKMSVAFLLLRLIGPNTVWRKRFLYFSIVSTFCFSVICCVLTFVQCDPPRALWEAVPGAKCWNPKAQSDYAIFLGCKVPRRKPRIQAKFSLTAWNAFIDFSLAILPVTIVWNLNIKIGKRIGLGCSVSGSPISFWEEGA